MSNYNKAIAFTLKYEGGYVNDPEDRGGETYRGITRKNHPNWPGWAKIDEIKPVHGVIIPELEDEVNDFYRDKYWGLIENICNGGVAAFVFDWKVNSGFHAIEALQKIIGAKVDGVLGNNTILKTNNYNGSLLSELIAARRKFVADIVRRSPIQKKFLNGWLNRIAAFEASFL